MKLSRDDHRVEPALAKLLPFERRDRRPATTARFDYDIAVSFAGRQRSYVGATVFAARHRGLRVFYDADISKDWWGRNLLVEQRPVYRTGTRFVVPFISEEYLASPYCMDELRSATITALHSPEPYILPVVFGDIAVPTDLLHVDTVYLDACEHTPDQLAARMWRQVSRR